MNINNKESEFLTEYAITAGIQAIEPEDKEEYVIKYTNSELDKIQELTGILRLSKETLLESAISYLHFSFTNDQENTQKAIDRQTTEYIDELEKIDIDTLSPKDQDRLKGKIKLSPEASKNLDELNMKENINECLFTGISLLHEKLASNPKKK